MDSNHYPEIAQKKPELTHADKKERLALYGYLKQGETLAGTKNKFTVSGSGAPMVDQTLFDEVKKLLKSPE
jgi:hypothetical protein